MYASYIYIYTASFSETFIYVYIYIYIDIINIYIHPGGVLCLQVKQEMTPIETEILATFSPRTRASIAQLPDTPNSRMLVRQLYHANQGCLSASQCM